MGKDFVLPQDSVGLVRVGASHRRRGQYRREHTYRDVRCMPAGGTLRFTVQASGAGLEILGGDLPGTTIQFVTKQDGNLEAGTLEHTIEAFGNVGKIISEQFDSLDITWTMDPRTSGPSDLDDVQQDRPLILRIWHGIQAVPVQMPGTQGQGRIKGLVRGQVTIDGQALATIWNDDLLTNTVAGEGDRWSFEERSTAFIKLNGWVSTDAHTATWQVIIAGGYGPGPSDFAGIYGLSPATVVPVHTVGTFERVVFGAGTGLMLPCPPGRFNIAIYNDELAGTGHTYSYAIAVVAGGS